MKIKNLLVCSMSLLTLSVYASGGKSSEKWWPSQHGEGDQQGSTNFLTPEKAKEAASLIKKGNVYSLIHDLDQNIPKYGSRVFALRGTGAPAGDPLGDNSVIWNDDFLTTEIGQVGTQFDALGHFGTRTKDGDRYYNGFTGKEINGSMGLKKLGIEHVKPIFTKGILIDVEAYKGKMLEKGYEITVEDLKGALKKQGMSEKDITQGDVVLIHTGWGSLWAKDNARFLSGEPGIGISAAKWLAKKNIVIVGGDSISMEVVPNPKKNLAYNVHQFLLTFNGIHIMECVPTERLAKNKVYSFAFSYTPIPIKGATGSPANAIAIN